MSVLISAQSLSEAWVQTLAITRRAPRGRLAHVITSVSEPALEFPSVREALDKVLADVGSQSVDTVAERSSLRRSTSIPASTGRQT